MDGNKKENDMALSDQAFELALSNRLTRMELVELRKSKGLSQKQVAELSGLSVQCVSDIESTNAGNPTLRSMLKYLNCLGYELMFQKKTI